MKIAGVDFNEDWVAKKSLEEFIKHESHHGLSVDQLKEVYALCLKKTKAQVLKRFEAVGKRDDMIKPGGK